MCSETNIWFAPALSKVFSADPKIKSYDSKAKLKKAILSVIVVSRLDSLQL